MRVYTIAALAILNFIGVQLLQYGEKWAMPVLVVLAIALLVDVICRKPSGPIYALALVGGMFNFMGVMSSLFGVAGTIHAAVIGSFLLFSAHVGVLIGHLKNGDRTKKVETSQ